MNRLILMIASMSLAIFSAPLHADEKADALKLGQTKYVVCGACHGLDGNPPQPVPGIYMAPAYAQSEIVKGNPELMTLVILKGIQKQDGKFLGLMTPMEATLGNEDLAALITYVRNTWGKTQDHVTTDQVAAWRKKYINVVTPLTRLDIEHHKQEIAKANP